MDGKENVELFDYCSPKSILVITWYGRVKPLYCPFCVKAEVDVGKLKKGQYAKVDWVKLATNGKTVFGINGKAYQYFYFDILTHM
ncbi:hypothetical protein NYZ99_19555 [Maribacter litopenaei]|uniref:Uncharacterized protein n=1 Tax=Maribacter litopenaei TaxID=2976127 RepID=A0ABY5Y9U2_9FLAO|nr:hypothetical protein [Maribacter litopenaei]UWX54905.1 hypothetical protein NYZ99_19555 [Maribacter litopenaei]